MNFEELREKHPVILYRSYDIEDKEDRLVITYHFEIPNLASFYPKIEILKKTFKFKDIHSNIVKNMVFNIGMVELLSYFKCTCSKQVIVECGFLDEKQVSWYKKLYYLGLGEFRFINHISIDMDSFVEIISTGEKLEVNNSLEVLSGNLIPVGGGKDSNVTMELLSESKDDNLCFLIGSKTVSIECIKAAGYEYDKIVEINRIIDKNLLDLNSKGFLNGHTPFSAIVAFISYLVSYLLGKKYVVLSNEDSANETNVEGENINHQYSKTLEFENDFRDYSKDYLKAGVEYFSILRPITELQIAYLFSKNEKYHKIFKSCNVGSKKEPWNWCCNCPKCLFVYTILSPFLYKEKLVDIFGEDLFRKESLLDTFISLCGYGTNKPFECVGTYKEVGYSLTRVIDDLKSKNEELPYLLKYYDDNFNKVYDENILKYYNDENNLPEEFSKILKGSLGLC